jgi:transcriptional regulator with XRE-family HTH domain
LKKTLATNIKRAREELGLTQRDLAAAAKKSQRHITLIETAGANVTISTLTQLGRSLGSSVVDLLTLPAAASRSRGRSNTKPKAK